MSGDKKDYLYYDSKLAVNASDLQELYRFTRWGRGRSIAEIERMLKGLVAFCRVLTDFVFRGTLWDIMVHPDHQGKGLGSSLLDYALDHPALRNVPLIITYTSELSPFLSRLGFRHEEGAMMLLRKPIEYS
jgi:GNAT superfamily N-acetyltransferase